jgi:hypothetical protein
MIVVFSQNKPALKGLRMRVRVNVKRILLLYTPHSSSSR